MNFSAGQNAVADLAERIAGGSLDGTVIAVWGVVAPGSSFKAQADAAKNTVEQLLAAGAWVQAYSPDDDFPHGQVRACGTAYDAAQGARMLIVLADHEEFVEADFVKVREVMAVPAIIDARNITAGPSVVNDLGPSRANSRQDIPVERAGAPTPGRWVARSSGGQIVLDSNRFAMSPKVRRVARSRNASPSVSVAVEPSSPAALPVRGMAGKRAVDLIIGVPLALAALPLIAVFAIGVAIELRCWPFFTQWRSGRDGRSIKFLKIRTLPPNTPAYAHKFNLDTEALPKLARFLRRQHLDELPQLLLVPLGKMSLVGPRPKMPDDHEPIDATFSKLRTRIPQGCTGLWQVGEHAHLRVCDSAEYDYAYLRYGSVRLDLWILWRTALLLIGRNAPVSLKNGTTIPPHVRGRGFLDVDDCLPGSLSVAA